MSLLEKTARKLGLTIRYEPIFNNGEPWQSDGGVCRVQEEKLLIINSSAPADQRCHVILHALQAIELNDKFIPPIVRQMLTKQTIHPID
ncbi:MAG: hypothetical protein JXX29_23015 [Deltaproteobacteria bacterium]|nr:hypothetical protein [Deltaproteobacteria bacterium]MBN2674571.1 hypothetical protein [Deltaproteobacteria bacterium]